MTIRNAAGRDVEVNAAIIDEIKRRGDWHTFQQYPSMQRRNGPDNVHVYVLHNNGVGDDVHALPAIRHATESGVRVHVYTKRFQAPIYEGSGATVHPMDDARPAWMLEPPEPYGRLYELHRWCMRHEGDTNGAPTLSRFEQFAHWTDSGLPTRYSWRDTWGVSEPTKREGIVTALTATSPWRSYPHREALKQVLSGRDVVHLGKAEDGDTQVPTFRDMLELVNRARVVVSVDTGVLAIALALGTPAVALFGPSDEEVIVRQFTRYVAPPVTILRTYPENAGCTRPCNFHYSRGFQVGGKCDTGADCMRELPLGAIIDAIEAH